MKILTKVFVRDFFRSHSGLLTTMFVSIFMYCVFIQPTHVSPGKASIEYNLILPLTFVSTPLVMIFVLCLWILYASKVLAYMRTQINLPQNQFVVTGTRCLSKEKQFQVWLAVLAIISSPILFYFSFCLVLGFVYHFYLIPIASFFFVVAVLSWQSWWLLTQINITTPKFRINLSQRFINQFPKPFFSLYVFHLIDAKALIFLTVKFLGLMLLFAIDFFSLNDGRMLVIIGVTSLSLAVVNSFLVFYYHEFERMYLAFVKSLPISSQKLYLNFIAMYLLLLSPEAIYVSVTLHWTWALLVVLSTTAFMLFFHCVIYETGLKMSVYLQSVFYLFIGFFVIALFEMFWLLVLSCLVFSILSFRRNLYLK